MKQFFGSIDANGDGNIDASEMKRVFDFRQQQGQ
jgi:Ca2+-binding EF-hand superfamily protein